MKDTIEYNRLLTRTEFRTIGLKRFGGLCCVPGCKQQAVDAHHIMDRKLWKDGGYYLSNCAPLCAKHHIDAEEGVYSPYKMMTFAEIPIENLQRPDALDFLTEDEYKTMFMNEEIDKWGQ